MFNSNNTESIIYMDKEEIYLLIEIYFYIYNRYTFYICNKLFKLIILRRFTILLT